MGNKTASYRNVKPGRSYQFARWITIIFNPVAAAIFIAGLLSLTSIDDPRYALTWLGITVLVTTVPPVLYILYLVKIGYLGDFFMADRSKRPKPIAVILIWLIISAPVLYFIQTPFVLILALLGVLAQIALLGLVTVLWKISFHSATIMSAATVAVLLHCEWAWLILLLVPLVGWSRIRLRRHTFMQVVAGIITGSLVAIIGFYVIAYYIPLL